MENNDQTDPALLRSGINIDPRFAQDKGTEAGLRTRAAVQAGLSEAQPEGFVTESAQSFMAALGRAGTGIAKTAAIVAGDDEAAKIIDQQREKVMQDKPWLRPIDYGGAWENISKGGWSWVGQTIGGAAGDTLPYVAGGMVFGAAARGAALGIGRLSKAAQSAVSLEGVFAAPGTVSRAATAVASSADETATLIKSLSKAQKIGSATGAQVSGYATRLGDNYLSLAEEMEKNGVEFDRTKTMTMAVAKTFIDNVVETALGTAEADIAGSIAFRSIAKKLASDKTAREVMEGMAEATIFSKYFGSGSLANRTLKQAGGEGFEEGLQFINDEAFNALGAGKNIDYATAVPDLIENMVTGFVGGLGIGGVSEAMRVRAEKRVESFGEEVTEPEIAKLRDRNIDIAKTEEAFTAFRDTLPEHIKPVAEIVRNISYKMAVETGVAPEAYIKQLSTVFVDETKLTPQNMQKFLDGYQQAVKKGGAGIVAYLQEFFPSFKDTVQSVSGQMRVNGLRKFNDDIERDISKNIPNIIDQNSDAGKAKVSEILSAFSTQIEANRASISQGTRFIIPREDVASVVSAGARASVLRDLYVSGSLTGVKLEGTSVRYDIKLTKGGLVFSPTLDMDASIRQGQRVEAAAVAEAERVSVGGEVKDLRMGAAIEVAREEARTKRLEAIRSRAASADDFFKNIGLPMGREIDAKINSLAGRLVDPAYEITDKNEQDFYFKYQNEIDSKKETMRGERNAREEARRRYEASVAMREEMRKTQRGLLAGLLISKEAESRREKALGNMWDRAGVDPKTGKLANPLEITEEERKYLNDEDIAAVEAFNKLNESQRAVDDLELYERQSAEVGREQQAARLAQSRATYGNIKSRMNIQTNEAGVVTGGRIVNVTDAELGTLLPEHRTLIDTANTAIAMSQKRNQAFGLKLMAEFDRIDKRAEQLRASRESMRITRAMQQVPDVMEQQADLQAEKAKAGAKLPDRALYSKQEKLAIFFSTADAGSVLHEWMHHVMAEKLMPSSTMMAFKRAYGEDEQGKNFDQLKRENPDLSDTDIMARLKWTTPAEENMANTWIAYIRDNKPPEGADDTLMQAWEQLRRQFKRSYSTLKEMRFAAGAGKTVVEPAANTSAQQDEGFPVMGRDRGAAGRREAQFDERMRMRDAKENDARYLELAKDPEANKEELRRMVDEAAKRAGYTTGPVWHGSYAFDPRLNPDLQLREFKVRPSPFTTNTFHFGTREQARSRKALAPLLLTEDAIDQMVADGRLKSHSEVWSLWSEKPFYLRGNFKNDTDWNAQLASKIPDEFDGVRYLNEIEARDLNRPREFSYAIKDPRNAKSADLITRDDQGNIIPLSRRFESASPDIRFQQADVASEQDARYMELAKDPEANKGELQRIVDEAAKGAGYTVKAWHGTKDSSLREFDLDKVGSRSDPGFMGKGFYFSSRLDIAEFFGAKLGPIVRETKTGPFYEGVGTKRGTGEFYLGGKIIEYEAGFGSPTEKYYEVAEALGVKIPDSMREGIQVGGRGNVEASKFLADQARKNGIDVIAAHYPGTDLTEYVVFDPNQIKSADPITRDDQGNIIPPSQRFKTTSPDIRFQQADGMIYGQYEASNNALTMKPEVKEELDRLMAPVTPDDIDAIYGDAAIETIDDSRVALGSDPVSAQRSFDGAIDLAMQSDNGNRAIFGSARKAARVSGVTKEYIVSNIIGEYGYSSLSDVPDDMKLKIAREIYGRYGTRIRAATTKAISDERASAVRAEIISNMNAAPRTLAARAEELGSRALAVKAKNGIKWLGRKYIGYIADRWEVIDILEDDPDGPLHRFVGERLQAGDDVKYRKERQYAKRFRQLIDESGAKPDYLDQKVAAGGIMTSKAQLLSLYIHANGGNGDWKNLYSVKQAMKSNGITIGQFEDAIKIVANDKNLIGVVNASQKLFKEILAEIRPIVKSVTGEDMGEVKGLYLPMLRNTGLAHDADFMSIFETFAAGNFRKPSDVENTKLSFMRERGSMDERGGKLELDFRVAFHRYYTQSANYIGSAPAVKDVMAIMNTREVADSFAARFGDDDVYNRFMEIIRRDLSVSGRTAPYDSFEKGLSVIKNNAYSAFMSGNVWSVANQMLSLPAAFAFIPARDISNAIQTFATLTASNLSDESNPVVALIAKHAPHILKRAPNQAVEDILSTSSTLLAKSGMGGKTTFGVKTLIEYGFKPMQHFDMAITMSLWHTAFMSKMREAQKQGLSPDRMEIVAKNFANKVVRRSQNPSVYSERGLAQTRSEYLKSLTPFSGQAFAAMKANLAMVYPLIKGYEAGGWAGLTKAMMKESMTPENWKKIAFYNVIPAMLFVLISKRGELPDEDELMKGIIMYPLLSVPVLGPVLWGSVVSGFVGGDTTLLASALKNAGKLAKDLAEIPENGFGSKELGSAMRGAAQVTGIPLQPLRIAQTIVDDLARLSPTLPDTDLSGGFKERNGAARFLSYLTVTAAREISSDNQ